MNSTSLEKAIEEAYKAYASLVHRRCYAILKSEDEAWDITQEVFMKLWKHYNKIQEKAALLSWLYRVSTNLCISRLRKKSAIELDPNIPDSKADSGEKQLVLKEIMEKLMKPWNEKVRQAVVYIYIDGYNQEECAKLMGVGESTLRRYLTKFKRLSKNLDIAYLEG